MATVNISAWAKKTNTTLDEAARGITINLFSSIIENTRADTGRMKGNWQASIGIPITRETTRTDINGRETIRQMKGVVKSGVVNIITNNVPYAPYWEQQDAMVAKNMARIERNIKAEVRKAQ
jgi:hypothetical protein